MIRFKDELSDLEKLALIDMSYSRLDTYDQCHAKYFHTYITKEPRTFGPAAALGNVVHGVLEKAVGKPLDLGEMLVSMVEQREKYDPGHEIGQELMEVGEHLITEFVDNHGAEVFNVIGNELPFQMVIGSANLIGYIDLVTRERNQIRITDYKTGKWEVASKNIPDNLQLGIYALAASHYYPGETIHAELYYLRSGRRKGHTFQPEELDAVYKRVLAQVNEIINRTNFTPTNDARACNICDHGKSGVCPIGAARLRNRRW